MASDNIDARAPESVLDGQDHVPAKSLKQRAISMLSMPTIMAIGLILGGGCWLASQHLISKPATGSSETDSPLDPRADESDGISALGPLASNARVPPTRSATTDQGTARISVQRPLPENGPPPSMNDLRLADRLLISGSAGKSLELYGRLLRSDGARPHHARVLYRIAVAQELIGDWNESMVSFRNLVRSTNDQRMTVAGKLGQARIWMRRNEPEFAISLLAELAVAPPFASSANDRLAATTLFLLGFAYDAAAKPERAQTSADGILKPGNCASARPSWSPEWLLSLPDSTEAVESPTIPDTIDVLYRTGDHPEQSQLSVWFSRRPVWDSVEAIANKTGFTVHWSAAATHAVERRQQAVWMTNASLATVLDSLLAPFGLTWTYDGQQLAIATVPELEQEQLGKSLAERGRRALRRAAAEFSDSELAPFVYLTLGNAEFRQSNWIGADSNYRQILRLYPGSPVTVEAHFNIGLVELALGREQDAIETFYHVVDMASGHPLRAAAYCYVGKIHMESGDVAGSIRPLLRAATLADDDNTRGVAAITLSSAYLLVDNHHAANTVLMEYRDPLANSTRRNAAALLTAIAQLKAASLSNAPAQKGRAVVAAINQVTPADFFDSCGSLLIGEGMQLVGLLDQSAQLYAGALDTKLPPWVADQIRIRLVEYQFRDGAHADAEKHLDMLSNSADQQTERTAKLKLAKLQLMKGDWDACLAKCRQLIDDDLSSEQKAEVLRVMGQVFESQSQHYSAALCYAGMAPPAVGEAPEGRLEKLLSTAERSTETASPGPSTQERP